MTPDRSVKRPILDHGVLVPASIVTAVAGSCVFGALWLNSQFETLKFDIVNIKHNISRIEDRLAVPPWTVRDQRQWTDLLKARNPTVNVPDVQ